MRGFESVILVALHYSPDTMQGMHEEKTCPLQVGCAYCSLRAAKSTKSPTKALEKSLWWPMLPKDDIM